MSTKSPGEKLRRQRKRERERAAYESAMAPLRAGGASCATCKHFARHPLDRDKRHCSEQSDRDGYTIVTATDLCPIFSSRTTQEAEQ